MPTNTGVFLRVAMLISFTCPHCGKTTNVAEQYAGQSGPCASCGKTITIPSLNAPGADSYRPSGGSTKMTCLIVGLVSGVVAVFFIGIMVALLLPAVQAAREAARRMTCTNDLKQIALAMHNYHQVYHCFPPAYIPDKNGKPMHSWRVLLLPYMEEDSLYKEYRFDEPWDGPHNKMLLHRMPKAYQCPTLGNEGTMTSYAMIVGPHAVSGGPKSCSLKDIKDGVSNTLLVVEAANAGINWMEPRDLDAEKMTYRVICGGDSSKGKYEISSPHTGTANVAFCDGSVRSLASSTDPKVVKAMATIDGGEKEHIDREGTP
jgi:prepilin-type processing-associated H-X9-DG protein